MYGIRVITGPSAEPVSLEELRAQTRIDGADEDGLLAGYLLAARQHLEIATGRALASQTFEVTFDAFPASGEPLYLPRNPVESVTTVSYVDAAGATQTLAGHQLDKYRAPARILPAYGSDWPATRDQLAAVTVRFVAGYGANTEALPEPIRQALLLLAAHYAKNREAAERDAQLAQFAELPFSVSALISPYRSRMLV